MEEIEGEGLEGLLGERVTLYCINYIYAGTLTGVNKTFVKLKDAEIVYETGSHGDKDYSEVGKMPDDWYVKRSAIESFGKFK